MKFKWIAAVLAAGMLLSLAGCRAAGLSGSPKDASPKGDESEPSGLCGLEPVQFHGAQYIRTYGGGDGVTFPSVAVIRSVTELNDYYQKNRDIFDLERRDSVSADSTIGFLDACDAYDEDYFQSEYLVIIVLEEGSGSIRHKVTNVTYRNDRTLSVSIDTVVPEVGTCDMAQWHILLELDRQALVESADQVTLFLDGTPADSVPSATPAEPEMQTSEPPALELLYEGGSVSGVLGARTWNYSLGGDIWMATTTDCPHPLECQNLVKAQTVPGPYTKLSFAVTPDHVTVRCWPARAWGNTETESTPVATDGCTLTLMPGGFLYEVIATWESDGTSAYGTAHYLFCLIL